MSWRYCCRCLNVRFCHCFVFSSMLTLPCPILFLALLSPSFHLFLPTSPIFTVPLLFATRAQHAPLSLSLPSMYLNPPLPPFRFSIVIFTIFFIFPMSCCEITGFFCIARGNRLRINKPLRGPSASTASTGTWYALYDSTISCVNESFASAELRVYSPPSEVIHPDGSIVFVIGKSFIQTGQNCSLIDVSHMHVLPSDISSPDYQDRAPGFSHSFVSCIGLVCGEHNVLDDRSRVFPVAISEYVRDEIKSFQVMSVSLPCPRTSHSDLSFSQVSLQR